MSGNNLLVSTTNDFLNQMAVNSTIIYYHNIQYATIYVQIDC